MRIALVRLPRMLEEIAVHVLGSEPDLEIVARIRTTLALPRKIARARPDVVLVGRNGTIALKLLRKCPGLTVIAVAEQGRKGWLYASGREPVSLGALSPAGLVRAVRQSGPAGADGDRLDG
jgi:chemotaxis response regulator CheB